MTATATNWCSRDLPELPEFLRTLIGKAKDELNLRRIILYGSRARCDHRPTSDYDLAFELMTDDGWAKFVATQAEEVETLLTIDFLLLNSADESYKREIETTGKVLYECGES